MHIPVAQKWCLYNSLFLSVCLSVCLSACLSEYHYSIKTLSLSHSFSLHSSLPQTNTSFYEEYEEVFARFRETDPLADKNNSVPHNYVPFTYDAIYAMALALDKADKELNDIFGNISLANFTYADPYNITKRIFNHMANTRFNGISVSCIIVVLRYM